MPGAINWVPEPSGNDVSDPPILFNEGQPAKTINDAARAMMASMALWMLDNSGVNQAYGADAYTVITRQGVSAKAAARAHTLKFRTTTTNLNPCTLAADANPPRPWLRSDGTQFGPGDIGQNIVWSVVYDPDAQVYRTLSPTTEQAGAIKAFGGPNVPSGWEICDGRAVNRAAYVTLFGAISTLWGVGDGFQTFNLPDLRGRALFGANRGLSLLTAAGGLVGSLGFVGGVETVRMLATQMPSHIHTSTMSPAGYFEPKIQTAGAHDHGGTKLDGGHFHTGTSDIAGEHQHVATTDIAGDHAHLLHYSSGVVNAKEANSNAVYQIAGGVSGGQTDSSGAHQHTITTPPTGAHQHPFTTAAVDNHAHGIAVDGVHAHTIDPTPNHAHTLVIDAAGSGDPHPNVPPGAIVTWAIKT